MKAMILAAGLGTRLRPLTDDRPKALVTVAGRTLLQITLERLRSFGVHEVIVNTHHHAGMILDYLSANQSFGMRIEVSREETLLDTGGGLKNAAWFFLDSADNSHSNDPFILHNVDVISTIDLDSMVRFHKEHVPLATLAVQRRETSRYLLFNSQGQLRGRSDIRIAENADVHPLAFSGIHIISPSIFAKMPQDGPFSIIDAYLHLAAQGQKIIAYRTDESYWRDLGRPQSLIEAASDLESGKWATSKRL
jgi:NDP-sugar pyrophosphorylase family protein